MTDLRFHLRHFIPGLDGSSNRPWFADTDFDDSERRQLAALLYLDDLGLSAEAVLDGDFAFFDRHFDGVAEVPMEVWDVRAQDDALVFRLWLLGADGGQLFMRDTVEPVSVDGVVQSHWHGEQALGARLAGAQRRLREGPTDERSQQLRSVSFE